jgi:hypothetical protein
MPVLGTRSNASAKAYGFTSKKIVLPYQWIVVGGGGELYTSTSTTASSWTSRTSSFGTTAMNEVASNARDLYVAVGDSGKLATSSDGITWTQRTSSFGTDSIFSLAYGLDGYWVAGGENGKVAYSTDGITWTQKTTGITGNVYALAYGNGLWVSGNDSGAIYTATNPTGTWTSRTSGLGFISGGGLHYFKASSIWVAGTVSGTTTNAVASSTDGLTWTTRNSAIDNVLSFTTTFVSNSTVCAVGALTNILNGTYGIQSTANGTSWTSRTPASTTAVNVSGASDDANLLMLCGPTVQTSTNATTWTNRGSIGSFQVTGACHSSGTPSIR